MGGGTLCRSTRAAGPRDFNPPTPWGVGLSAYIVFLISLVISIHPPRGGWDFIRCFYITPNFYFNPPTPWGVGHTLQLWRESRQEISIHPPRGGWDGNRFSIVIDQVTFQSTHPVGGGTVLLSMLLIRLIFQSTHPVGGGTPPCIESTKRQLHFNPPTPWGVGPHAAPFPHLP